MKHPVIWALWFLLIGGGICCDCCPKQYCCKAIEDIFSYQSGELISIVAVIWAFMVSLCIYVLGKVQERHYGIRIEDVLIYDLKCHGIWAFVGIILAELLVLIIATIGEWKITLVFLSLFQFYTMIYFFLMICLKITERNILDQIGEEIKTKKNLKTLQDLMLADMLRNLQYDNEEQIDELIKILQSCILPTLKNMLKDKEKSGDVINFNNEKSRDVINFSSILTQSILQNGKKAEIVLLILQNWRTAGDMPVEVKMGISDALIKNSSSPDNFEIFKRLLSTEKDDQVIMQIQGIVCNLYRQQFEGETWRRSRSESLAEGLNLKDNENFKLAKECWDWYSENRQGNQSPAPLLNFVFGEEGDML